ncbi:hypothetical protein IL306_007141 [Fusarium sp. DS 682]|nr:hypothetical protein IL306_007141 [Fusarium sp. DS 682]
MTNFTAETFTFLSSIKTPAIEGGIVRTRLLVLMDNLQAPKPQEIIEWIQMPEFRVFAFDNLKVNCVKTWSGYRTDVPLMVIFLRLGEWMAKMLGRDEFDCKVDDNYGPCTNEMESVDGMSIDDMVLEGSHSP